MILPELLAPAGTLESLHAAVKGGCNAVYFGVENFNMRNANSFAFFIDDIKKITAICHTNNIRIYGALNTIIYTNELSRMQSAVYNLKKCNVDAVIASDISVINFAGSISLPVHISTQLSVSNIDAVRFYAKFSDRIVLARELDLKSIKKIITLIKKHCINGPSGNLVEIEVFIHGALCTAVSGRCWMSLHQYNTSANRGNCLQPCRRGYLVTDIETGDSLQVSNKYIMSPRDLSVLPFLDRICSTGVRSLKIEGRARSPEYVLTVTSAYRKALDAINSNSFTPKLIKSLMDSIHHVYNRGYSGGYYLGKKKELWSKRYGSQATHRKIYFGKLLHFYSKAGAAEVLIEAGKLFLHEEVIITGPTTGILKFIPTEMRINNTPVTEASRGSRITILVPEKVRPADRFYVFRKIRSD